METEQKRPEDAELASKLRTSCAAVLFPTLRYMADAELIAASEEAGEFADNIEDKGSSLAGFFHGVAAVLDAEVLRRAAETVALPTEDV